MSDTPLAERPRFLPTGGPPASFVAANEQDRAETDLLRALEGLVALAPRVWVPAHAEAAFYRLNQLERPLKDLFGREASTDPDEDEIEDLVPLARELVASRMLDDRIVEAFYEACAPLPERVEVRRLGEVGTITTRGRPALLAMRAAWEEAWSLTSLMARLRSGDGLIPSARPIVIHAVSQPADAGLLQSVGSILEAAVKVDGVLMTSDRGLVSVRTEPREAAASG